MGRSVSTPLKQKCFLPLLTFAISSLVGGCFGSPAPSRSSSTQATIPPSPVATQPSPKTERSQTTEEVERAIGNDLPRKIGVPIQSVTCPNQDKLAPGQVFDCKAKVEQGSFPVKVTVKDAKGHLNFKTRQLLVLSEAEKSLQASIKKAQGIEIKADCGGKVKVFQKVGDRFDCKLSNPSGKIVTATITVVSEEGKVDAKWKL